jgi:mRNA interferase MazF
VKQQELVWIRFPFSNLRESKIRPGVIISNEEYNKENKDVLVCSITSNLEKKPHSIFISNLNLLQGELPIESKIRADKIMLLEKDLIIKPFAKLDNETFEILISEIIKLIKRTNN